MQIQFQTTDDDKTQTTHGAIPIKNKRSQVDMARQIISARQLQELANNDVPVFLSIVRTNEPPNKRDNKRGKRSQGHEEKFAAAHGIIEGQKRHIDKQTGLKKDFISVEER